MSRSTRTPDGYVIDPSNAYLFVRIADSIEQLLPELDAIIRKEIRRGRHDQPHVRSNKHPLPINPDALATADEIRDTIYTWISSFAQSRGDRHNFHALGWHVLATYIRKNVQPILRWTDAPTMLDELTDALHRAQHLIDGPQPLPLVGPCPECRHAVYAPAYVPEPQCSECGTPLDRTERLHTMRERAAQAWLSSTTARHVAQLITGKEIKPATMRQWAKRGHIRTRPGPTYSVQDLIDRTLGITK